MLPYMFGNMIADQPFLARGRVRYNGEPIALVIAESELEAQMAADAVEASYEDLPAVFDVFEAMKEGAPLLHEDQHAYRRDAGRYPALEHTNICNETSYELGDVEKAFARADHVFEHCFFSHPTSHCAMEPFGSVARYDAVTGRFTLWTTTDARTGGWGTGDHLQHGAGKHPHHHHGPGRRFRRQGLPVFRGAGAGRRAVRQGPPRALCLQP